GRSISSGSAAPHRARLRLVLLLHQRGFELRDPSRTRGVRAQRAFVRVRAAGHRDGDRPGDLLPWAKALPEASPYRPHRERLLRGGDARADEGEAGAGAVAPAGVLATLSTGQHERGQGHAADRIRLPLRLRLLGALLPVRIQLGDPGGPDEPPD